MMVDTAYELLGDADISYLGLETERFESLRLIGEQLNLSPEQSYVIESDPRVYEAMLSIQNRRTAAMRAVLNGLNIRHGRIEEEAKKLSGPFNLVYLDFFGHTSPAKQSRLVNLIEENKLGASALVVVKVSNSPLSKFRAKHLYGTEDQSKIISDWTNLPSPSCHSVQRKFLVSYKGGTEANNGEEMLAVGFEIKREM